MKRKLYVLLVISLLVSASTAFADSSPFNTPPGSSDMRVFRLTANEVQSVHVKWGPRFRWMLTRNEIDSLLTILRKARKEDIKPYYGPMPKGGPFQVSLMTKSNEHFTFTVGAGGEGYVLCEGARYFCRSFVTL
ncbi:hypothetical protein [Paenibacillus sp. Soil522]|uniref:hypothetical protein n=1 Tax=Paenibacillus sp. Soil522 TaxID=1736388 RepID=UPI0006F5D7D5|nr:hypothetical protein [Paenibacillus sp. Soil522]KRE40003.1 hypothetical protein ASG81_18965 [Paenibacillus sp. Soil522]